MVGLTLKSWVQWRWGLMSGVWVWIWRGTCLKSGGANGGIMSRSVRYENGRETHAVNYGN